MIDCLILGLAGVIAGWPAVCLLGYAFVCLLIVDPHDCLTRVPCFVLLAVIFMAGSLALCGICLLSMDLISVMPMLQLPLTFD